MNEYLSAKSDWAKLNTQLLDAEDTLRRSVQKWEFIGLSDKYNDYKLNKIDYIDEVNEYSDYVVDGLNTADGIYSLSSQDKNRLWSSFMDSRSIKSTNKVNDVSMYANYINKSSEILNSFHDGDDDVALFKLKIISIQLLGDLITGFSDNPINVYGNSVKYGLLRPLLEDIKANKRQELEGPGGLLSSQMTEYNILEGKLSRSSNYLLKEIDKSIKDAFNNQHNR